MCMPTNFGSKLIDGKMVTKSNKQNSNKFKKVVVQTSVEFEVDEVKLDEKKKN